MAGRLKRLGLTGATVLLLAGGIVLYSRRDREPEVASATLQPVPVIATAVEQRDMPIILTGLGTVTALNAATVRSQITGLLVSIDFQEGQSVKKGDVLARIDPRIYQAQLDEAEATLAHDKIHLQNVALNLQRYNELLKEDSASRQMRDNQQAAVDELTAQIKNDEAAVEYAKNQLSYTSLVAPFDGVTGIRLLDVGNIIQPPSSSATAPSTASSPSGGLVVVTELQPICVIFSLPTTNIAQLRDAMAKGPVSAIALSQDDKTQLDAGALVVVNNQADPGSGTVELKAQFPNPQRRLWPGMFVNVQLVTSTVRDGLTIPFNAIEQGPHGQFVFVVGPDHRVTIRPVSVRQSLHGVSLIEKGLSAGETVVVQGQYRLSSALW